MTPKQISEIFGVSIDAAKIRLIQIERMRRFENGARRERPDFVKKFLDDAQKRNPG